MLALADHAILTYGTFGMWGALLGNAKNVVMPKGYSKHRATKNIEMAKIKDWIFLWPSQFLRIMSGIINNANNIYYKIKLQYDMTLLLLLNLYFNNRWNQ